MQTWYFHTKVAARLQNGAHMMRDKFAKFVMDGYID